MVGIEVLKKVIVLGVDTIGELSALFVEQSSMGRIKILIGLADNAMDVAQLDFATMKQEFIDLDANERIALVAYLKVKLDLSNDVLEKTIESTIDWLAEAVSLIEKGAKLKGLYV